MTFNQAARGLLVFALLQAVVAGGLAISRSDGQGTTVEEQEREPADIPNPETPVIPPGAPGGPPPATGDPVPGGGSPEPTFIPPSAAGEIGARWLEVRPQASGG